MKGSYPRNISIIATVFICLILFLAIVNFYVSIQLRSEFINYDREKVISVANLCAGYMNQYHDPVTLRYALKEVNDAFNLGHMIIIDTLGNKLYDSRALPLEFDLGVKKIDLRRDFKKLPLFDQLIHEHDRFIFLNPDPPFYLYTVLSFSYTSIFDRFFKWYIFYITISLFFLGFLGIFLIRNLFLPMRYVARLAHDMGVEMKKEDFVPATFNQIYKKMKAKEETLIEFSSYVAHEFRNSIGAIIGLARLVEKGKKPAADIVVECRLMENLIKRLLEYAQPLKAILTPVQISQLINEAIKRAKIPARIKVKLKLSDDVPELMGDHELLSVVLSNLVQNSVAAIARKGFIEIESGKEDDFVFIKVRDNGQGMDESAMDKIFKPFYSATDKGMGLGLAYVNKVVEIHNGRISVESKKGEGTEFTLKFPIKG